MDIKVSRPFLPPIKMYSDMVAQIWNRAWLTNQGPLAAELESRLASYLDLPRMLFTTSGTVALQLAIKALGLQGEVITTPFSYVATTSAIIWQGCTPRMVDICPVTLNLDPERIEAAITPRTSAILATHVYGNACDVQPIQDIARRRGLKVIYDGAHAFGTSLNSRSLFAYGDVAIASFHATKLFHTVEGGGLFSADPALLQRMAALKNFGQDASTSFSSVGINGKNSELHAAMGLCNLQFMGSILQRRKAQSDQYDGLLAGLPLRRPSITPGCTYNHAYYPVIFPDERTALGVCHALAARGVEARRYFYPSLDTLTALDRPDVAAVSRNIACRVLCLPLYHELTSTDVERICAIIQGCFGITGMGVC